VNNRFILYLYDTIQHMSYFICIHCALRLISSPNFDLQNFIFIFVPNISSIAQGLILKRNVERFIGPITIYVFWMLFKCRYKELIHIKN